MYPHSREPRIEQAARRLDKTYMLVSIHCRQLQFHRPRTFLGLMELYEENYIRFRRLCPDIRVRRSAAVSAVPGALDLHLKVLEQTAHTTTVRLTYLLRDGDHEIAPEPDLRVRIYHDARQAEVLSRSCRRGGGEFSVHDFVGRSELLRKWRSNRFLYKWLGYCRYQGHVFADSGSSPELRTGPTVRAHKS